MLARRVPLSMCCCAAKYALPWFKMRAGSQLARYDIITSFPPSAFCARWCHGGIYVRGATPARRGAAVVGNSRCRTHADALSCRFYAFAIDAVDLRLITLRLRAATSAEAAPVQRCRVPEAPAWLSAVALRATVQRCALCA